MGNSHSSSVSSSQADRSWPLEKALFLLGGTMTCLAAVLAAFVSPWFLLLSGFVGLNMLLFAAFGTCGAAMLLERVFGFQRGI